MNAIASIRPPVKPDQGAGDSGNAVIGVRILMPESLAALFFFPGTTHGGAELLGRLLQAKIEAAGCRVLEASHLLPFHRSLYVFDVPAGSQKRALEAVSAELSALKFLEWGQVAWDDPREGIWRLYHPKAGVFPMPSDAELAADRALVRQTIEALEALKAVEMRKRTCDGPVTNV